MRGRRKERGVALLVTLLVIVLLTIVVTEFTFSTTVNANLTRNALSALQAEYLARSGVQLAEMSLERDLQLEEDPEAPKPAADTLLDPWAVPFPPMPVGERFGLLGFVITDRDGRFNLNSLALDPNSERNALQLEMRKELFQAILSFVGADSNLLFPVLDWLDANEESESQAGAEEPYYLGLQPPYRPRNGPFLTVDELALVRGFEELTPNQWRSIRDMVTVLPGTDLEINLNTAPRILLTAVFSFYNAPEVAEAIVRERESVPFRKREDIRAFPGMDILKPEIRRVFEKTRSERFDIHAIGRAGDVERGLVVGIERRRRGKSASIERLSWQKELVPAPLTSPEASDQIDGDFF